MKIIFSPEAEADLSGIWHYIAEDNPDAADRFVAKIKKTIFSMSPSPKIGHRCDRLATGLRSLPVGQYLIFYRATP